MMYDKTTLFRLGTDHLHPQSLVFLPPKWANIAIAHQSKHCFLLLLVSLAITLITCV